MFCLPFISCCVFFAAVPFLPTSTTSGWLSTVCRRSCKAETKFWNCRGTSQGSFRAAGTKSNQVSFELIISISSSARNFHLVSACRSLAAFCAACCKKVSPAPVQKVGRVTPGNAKNQSLLSNMFHLFAFYGVWRQMLCLGHRSY